MELITVGLILSPFFVQNLGKISQKNEDKKKPVNISKIARIESL